MSPRPFPNVIRRGAPSDPIAIARAQVRKVERIRAENHVRVHLAKMFEGCAGQFESDVLEALFAQTADRGVAHKDAAFANSRLGLHAGRVGREQDDALARVQANFRMLRLREDELDGAA